jgi:hypothetical protein
MTERTRDRTELELELMKRVGSPIDRLDNFITKLFDGGLLRYDRRGSSRSHGLPGVVVRIDRQPDDDNMRIEVSSFVLSCEFRLPEVGIGLEEKDRTARVSTASSLSPPSFISLCVR